jgi:phage tail protein X
VATPPAPTKLTITAYTDSGFTSRVSGSSNPFTAWINPSSYSYNKQISYTDRQAQGSPGPSPEFNRVADETVTFDMVFDATGVIPPPTGQSYTNGVSDIINQFLTLAGTVNGNIHSPNYLVLGWSKLQFQCVLASVKIDYTLFMPNGTPLRAKVSATFKSYTSETALAKETATNSPDMTHIFIFQPGDTLPLLCYRVYGDSSYYAEVARYNNLLSFRSIPAGISLVFPPLAGAQSGAPS